MWFILISCFGILYTVDKKKRLQKEIKTLDRSDLSEALYSALNITLSVQHYGQSISEAVKQPCA